MVKVCTNVFISHLHSQAVGLVGQSDPLGQIGDEILQHEADIARVGNATVRRGHISELHLELLKQGSWILGHEYLLDQNERLLEERLVLVDLDLVVEHLEEFVPLLRCHRIAKVVQHEVIVENHIVHQVAILVVANLCIDRLKHLLCFLEYVGCLLCFRLDFSQCHGVLKHCLICRESFFAVNSNCHVHCFFGKINDWLELLICARSQFFQQNFDFSLFDQKHLNMVF